MRAGANSATIWVISVVVSAIVCLSYSALECGGEAGLSPFVSHGANSVTFSQKQPVPQAAHSTIRRGNPQGRMDGLTGILFALFMDKQDFGKLLGSV